MFQPVEMYNVISVTGATSSYVSFDILGTAIRSADGKVVIMNESAKRTGTYYFANDTAVLPFANKTDKKRQKPVMGDYNNSTINVAEANAVIAMKNVSTSGGRGNFTLQFSDVGTYLPNGTVKNYKLTTPARITRSADNKSMMIVGNPSLRAAMQDALMGGNRFPANAAPVMLKAIDGVK